MKRRTPNRDYARSARMNSLVKEILAEELDRIDDERLELVSLTSVDVATDLATAVAYYDHSLGEDADEGVNEALEELRPRLQGAIARQTSIKATPILSFEPDKVVRSAARIEDVLRGLKQVGSDDA